MRHLYLFTTSLLLLTGSALAQGDDCSNPTPITGTGTWFWDNTANTTSGFDGGDPTNCFSPANAGTTGIDTIRQDLFYVWTVPADGNYLIDTENSSINTDTKMSVHAGSDCNATCFASDDDGGTFPDFSSKVALSGLVAGDQYLIQIGSWDDTSPVGAGQLNITDNNPVQNPANGHYYEVVPLQSINWNDAKTAAENMSYLGIPGHLVTINDQAEMDWLLNNLTWDRPWTGLWQDPGDPGYSEPGGGWVWVTGEPLTFTNWIAGEPNDNPVGENSMELLYNLAGSNTALGGWNDTLDSSATQHEMIIEYEAQGPILFCNPAANNSSGNFATLANSDISGPGVLHLEAEGGPAGQFGYFLVSSTLVDPGVPVSQGFICLGAPQGRYNGVSGLSSLGQFDGAGILQNIAGTSSVGSGFDVPQSLPSPPGGVIAPGSSWYFQLWYRDGANSNFSDTIRVDF